ncbi:MAG: anthranilate phosphoribosyltransferase [Sandaracinaceae bacterium]
MSVLWTAIERARAGETLSAALMHDVMAAIVDGHASSADTSAFLTALATRTERLVESPDELVAAAEVLRARMIAIAAPRGTLDTCGTGGSGRPKLNVSTLTAIVVASLGVPVAKHGNRSSVHVGSSDVLEAMGVPLLAPAASASLLVAQGLAFLHAPHHHPALARVAPVRRALGIRTIFNLLGPLASPARVRRQVVGTTDPRRAASIAVALTALGAERALVFAGAVDELPIDAPTHGYEVRAGEVRPIVLDPAQAGVAAMCGHTGLRDGADGFRDALEGHAPPAVEQVAWSAAVALTIAGEEDCEPGLLAQHVSRARSALRDGRVADFFEAHRARARALAADVERAA